LYGRSEKVIDLKDTDIGYLEGINKGALEPKVWRDGDGVIYAVGARAKGKGPFFLDVMWIWFRDGTPGTEEEMMQLAQNLVDLCYLRRK
jgi:hypothetical protein